MNEKTICPLKVVGLIETTILRTKGEPTLTSKLVLSKF